MSSQATVMRRVDDNVYQSDFDYALRHGDEYDYIVSVAFDCIHPKASLVIRQVDNEYIPADRYFTVYEFIISHRGKILIHCCVGMSRSVAYSLGYLILRYNITLDDAKRRMGIDYKLHPDIERSLIDLSRRVSHSRREAF